MVDYSPHLRSHTESHLLPLRTEIRSPHQSILSHFRATTVKAFAGQACRTRNFPSTEARV